MDLGHLAVVGLVIREVGGTAWCFEKIPCKEARAMPPEDVLC